MFLDEADAEFAIGKTMRAAEMPWGAVAHARIAVAWRNGWTCSSRGALKNVARQLINVPGESDWLTELDVTERFHSHFHHGQMTDQKVTDYRPRVRLFASRLPAVANTPF